MWCPAVMLFESLEKICWGYHTDPNMLQRSGKIEERLKKTPIYPLSWSCSPLWRWRLYVTQLKHCHVCLQKNHSKSVKEIANVRRSNIMTVLVVVLSVIVSQPACRPFDPTLRCWIILPACFYTMPPIIIGVFFCCSFTFATFDCTFSLTQKLRCAWETFTSMLGLVQCPIPTITHCEIQIRLLFGVTSMMHRW